MANLDSIPTKRIHWKKAVRIIPSRYPPINLFERVTDPLDLDAAIAVESEPNPYSVYYYANREATAIAETVYHRERFMREVQAPPMDLDQRVLIAEIRGTFHDIRNMQAILADIYAPDSYVASQAFGNNIRANGSNGITYNSVRDESGECSAIFKPALIHKCRQDKHLVYRWDGVKIAGVYQLKML